MAFLMMTEGEIQSAVSNNSLRAVVESFMEMADESIRVMRHVFDTHLHEGIDALDGVYLGSNIFLDWIREANLLDDNRFGLDVISLTIPDTWLSAGEDELRRLRVPPPYVSVTLFKLPIDRKKVQMKRKPGAEDAVPGIFEKIDWPEELFNQVCRRNLERFDLWRSTPPKTHKFVEHNWFFYS